MSEKPARWRQIAAATLLTLGVAAAPLAVGAAWVRSTFLDTDAYVAAVAPLADDPDVQVALAAGLTDRVTAALDVSVLTSPASDALTELGLARLGDLVGVLGGPLEDAVARYVAQAATAVVESPTFATVWAEANRAAHGTLTAALRGDDDALASIDAQGGLTVQLNTLSDRLIANLAERGVPFVERLPIGDLEFTVIDSSDLHRLVTMYRVLDVAGLALPIASGVLLTAGMAIPARRRRMLTVTGLALALVMALFALILAIFRARYLTLLGDTELATRAAAAVFDQLSVGLRTSLRLTALVGFLLLVIGYVTGASESARSLRAAPTQLLARAQGRGPAARTPLARWLAVHRNAVLVGIGAAAVIALLIPAALHPLYVTAVVAIAVGAVLATMLAGAPDSRAAPEETSPQPEP